MKLSDADADLVLKMWEHTRKHKLERATFTVAGVTRLLEIIVLLQDELKKNDPHLRH